MKKFFQLLASLVLFAPTLALAAPRNFSELANMLVGLISTATGVLIVFALVAYFYGVATNIPHFGSEKGAEKIKSYFFWGILILFVMVSIWGIVELLQNTLFGGSPNAPNNGAPAVQCDSFGNCG